MSFKAGYSVRVKEWTPCPDQEELCIGGWQGRISEIIEDEKDDTLVCIQWDSITLENMPDYFIDQCDEEGLDYTSMFLCFNDLEHAECRDTEKDVEKVIETISKTHFWSWLGEEGKRIQNVLASIDKPDMMESLKAWKNFLEENFTFPFDAEVLEFMDSGPLQTWDKVSVKKICIIEEHYGIIVELRRGPKKYHLPLSTLGVIDMDSPNYQPVKDYCVWFANRY